MADAAVAPTSTPADNAESGDDDTGDTAAELGDGGKKALEEERSARKEADRQRKALERELNTLRQSSMNESEKAVAEAEQRGRTAALTEFGQRLARSEFATAAARRNPAFDAAAVADDLNLARFLTEDGEPDMAAIAKAVERLVPAGNNEPPSFDGGTRSTAKTTDMNQIIRDAGRRR